MNPEDVHKLAGALVLLLTLLLLGRELGLLRGGWTRHVLPGGLIALGSFLILDPIVFHGGSFGAEGFQHQIQGLIALGIGVIEGFRARGRLQNTAFALAFPIGIAAVGLLFIFHGQHGGGTAMQVGQHRILGATLVASGMVKTIDAMKRVRGNWASVGWLLLLIVVSTQLFLYSEGGDTGASAAPAAAAAHITH